MIMTTEDLTKLYVFMQPMKIKIYFIIATTKSNKEKLHTFF